MNNRIITATSPSIEEQFITHINFGRLMYLRGKHDGEALEYSACPSGVIGGMEWACASGEATLYSFAIYHQAYSSDFQTPYNICQIKLQEGPLLISVVDVKDMSDLYVGMPLIAAFTPSRQLVFKPKDRYRGIER